jgi:hypothetical protein
LALSDLFAKPGRVTPVGVRFPLIPPILVLPQYRVVVLLRNMKKLLITSLALVASMATLMAGSVTLAWDHYTSDTNVTLIKVYAVVGTNTVFLTNNSNATVIRSTSVVNDTLTVSNLSSGAWTFVATAATASGLESSNSPSVWTIVPVAGVVNVRITGTSPQ